MKLFTKGDVERAARIAAITIINDHFASGSFGVEYAVSRALETVVEETPPYYDEDTVLLLLEYVAHVPDVSRPPRVLLEEALAYIRR